jgi:hypothetical protein
MKRILPLIATLLLSLNFGYGAENNDGVKNSIVATKSSNRELIEAKFKLGDRSRVSTQAVSSTATQYLNFQFFTSATCDGQPYETQVFKNDFTLSKYICF